MASWAGCCSVAAARLGFRTHVFEPGAAPPAADVAHALTTAPYDDTEALRAFAEEVDVVTYEFENVPAEALDLIEAIRPIRPGARGAGDVPGPADRKELPDPAGADHGAVFSAVNDADDLSLAIDQIGLPAILKTRRLGYDGKGQTRLTDPDHAEAALTTLAGGAGDPRRVRGLRARSLGDRGARAGRGRGLFSTRAKMSMPTASCAPPPCPQG